MIEKFSIRQWERKEKKRRRPAGHDGEDVFLCRNCRRSVYAGTGYMFQQNRNHCPYCLHSRHLDLVQAGDRLSACKGVMRPVGLTCKRCQKKYGSRQGELMLVHQCIECGKISINRIAWDDDAQLIFDYYQQSLHMPVELRDTIEAREIEILGEGEMEFVISRLFGRMMDSIL